MKVEIDIPDKCSECGFENVNIWGTRIQGELNISVKCAKCGKFLSKLTS